MQSNSGFQVRNLLTETQRQSGKAPHVLAHCEILPLYKASRNMFRIRITHSDFGYDPRDAWWGVPRVRSIKLPVIPEHFGELREVRIQSKRDGHTLPVVIKPIGRDLCLSFDPVVKIRAYRCPDSAGNPQTKL